MLKMDADIEWRASTEKKSRAFKDLRAGLASPPILALRKPHRPYMIDYDASQYEAGTVLLQQHDDELRSEWATLGY